MSSHDSIWEAVPEGAEPELFSLRRRFLLDHVRTLAGELGRPPQVLDVGCGEGQFTSELARAGALALGADTSREALRRARARHPALDWQLIPVDGPWPLADAGYDVVWAGETIEHVADTAAWMSELRRVLRPHGVLLLSTPAHSLATRLATALSGKRFEQHFDPRGDHVRFYTARSLRALLSDFGFERIDVRSAAGPPGARRALLASARRMRF
jgi:2-polyprenyl-6-hydroxyphenyl methylase/3-demethylubiquinone-9 3-methyltransferase